MTAKNRSALKTSFQTGDIPTGDDFSDMIDSAVNTVDTSSQSVASALAVTGALSGGSLSSSTTLAVGVQTLAGVGSIQGTAAQIASSYVVATNTGTDLAYLLPSTVGSIVIFRNSGANTAKVFPISGAAIDALSANAAYDVSTGDKVIFVCESSTQYASYAF